MTTVLAFPVRGFSAAELAALRCARDRLALTLRVPVELTVIREDPADAGFADPGEYAVFEAPDDSGDIEALLTIQCTREPARRFVRILTNGKAGPASNDLHSLLEAIARPVATL